MASRPGMAAIEEFIAEYKNPGTKRNYRSGIQKFLAWKYSFQITGNKSTLEERKKFDEYVIVNIEDPPLFEDVRFSGIVPFIIDRGSEIPTVKGEGTIQNFFNGSAVLCPIIMTPNPAACKTKLSGSIKTLKRPIVKPTLQITIDRKWEPSVPIWMIICPGKPPEKFGGILWLYRETIEFYNIKDGDLCKRDVSTPSGTFSLRWILHFTK